ncbi:kinesin motor domain protein [Ichthyophthirius multifiliis]|uniref:Kinesin motor domain protein n=1 Tax=Ichthyophthirius multifiliis TaxID=5932 RepID=G0R5V7_ICHMU|nr:kinesin motor domain protein [Ichthyophthirius multifiliis]EGR27134.1 kinesin motor domain protein [Ichthyophthirius multifiliis]|eukprot:XP_004024018.1 kinesin motor domain protein [Ichthyophthirius multifiliis]
MKVSTSTQQQNAVVKNKFKDKNYLEHKLQKFLPKVLEINLIAKELKRNISLQAKIASDIDNQTSSLESQTSKIQIQVDNRELGQVYIWDQPKFNERYYLIKDLLEKYFETNELPALNSQNDPFYDPPEAHIIGSGYFKLLYLAYFMDSQIDLSLVGENGQCGTLSVSLIPCNETGDKNLAEEMENENSENIIEEPGQLLGKQLYFKIVISKAQLPELFCRDTYVEYTLMNQQGKMETYQTQKIIGKNSKPNYNYSKIHSYSYVTEEHLYYLQERNLVFKVLGLEEIKGEKLIQTQIPVEEEIEFANNALLQQTQKPQNKEDCNIF